MLKVRSFDILDDSAMNALLETNRLAPGGHILVSDGKICIPYEDGEPENNDQRRVRLMEERNKMVLERDLHIHSKEVNEGQIADLQAVANSLEETYMTKPNDKETERLYRDAQAKVTEFENLQLQGQSEIRRITYNIEAYNRAIAALN